MPTSVTRATNPVKLSPRAVAALTVVVRAPGPFMRDGDYRLAAKLARRIVREDDAR